MNAFKQASRVALLCNIAFLICLGLRYITFRNQPDGMSLLIIMGWFMAFWISLAVNVWAVVLWIRRNLDGCPRWLVGTNAVLWTFQACYHFLL